ncbi:mille-pattes peptide 1 [Tribolium castaneum]|uniref:Mlpt peptide 1 n=1 Tax=Tribolium castaneum TaxID=7070 RepID=Q0VU43_TRICA|nr:mille-pattes peptide 1 [Tribolium castaneum]CAK30048.1 mlpt peptide 1 [Tribolium castaneum]|eukprot:NP_001107856.1 mille-pattes peptide 1 [Tribolium castaneum]
MSGLDPTGLY